MRNKCYGQSSYQCNTTQAVTILSLKSMTPSKQCAQEFPPATPSTAQCPACVLDFLHISKRSLFALWFAPLQLHPLDSVLGLGLKAVQV